MKIIFLIFLAMLSNYCVTLKRYENNKCFARHSKDEADAARKIMRELLPSPDSVDLSSSNAIPDLLGKLKKCFELAREGSTGDTQTKVLAAMSDAVGCYLRSLMLPVARGAYYAGLVSYEDVNQMMMLYEEMKSFLNSSDSLWRAPNYDSFQAQFEIKPLEASTLSDKDACNHILLSVTPPCGMKMPVPHLSGNPAPTTLTVALKDRDEVNILNHESAFIIPEFYVFAMKCLNSQDNCKDEIKSFNVAMYHWVVSKIVPHFKEEVWYIGFGGVLNVLESINDLGIDSSRLQPNVIPEGQYTFGRSSKTGKTHVFDKISKIFERIKNFGHEIIKALKMNSNSAAHVIVLIVVLVLSSLLGCFCCLLILRKKVKLGDKLPKSGISDKLRSIVSSFRSSLKKTPSAKYSSLAPSSSSNKPGTSRSSTTYKTRSPERSMSIHSNKDPSPNEEGGEPFSLDLAHGEGWIRVPPSAKQRGHSQSMDHLASGTSSSFLEEESAFSGDDEISLLDIRHTVSKP